MPHRYCRVQKAPMELARSPLCGRYISVVLCLCVRGGWVGGSPTMPARRCLYFHFNRQVLQPERWTTQRSPSMQQPSLGMCTGSWRITSCWRKLWPL